ncbi:MAG: prepilin peptidase [Actinobacteria bacterium]|nr:prepilin peptidase [Actinomycetota bacterium]
MTRSALSGLIGAGLFTVIGLLNGAHGVSLPRLALFGAALGVIALIDLREHRIPNRIVLPAIAICAVLAGPAALRHSLPALALVALLLVLAFVQPAALGMGDVKQALLIAVALGAAATSALLLGFALAALVGIAMTIQRGRSALATALPLAPFLAAGATIALALT